MVSSVHHIENVLTTCQFSAPGQHPCAYSPALSGVISASQPLYFLLFKPACSAGQRISVLSPVLPLRTASHTLLFTLKTQGTKMPQNDPQISLTIKANFQEKNMLVSFLESAVTSVSYSNIHECQRDQKSCSFGDLKKQFKSHILNNEEILSLSSGEYYK